jgi:hypothetical protein
MGSVRFQGKRQVWPDGTIRMKGKRYYDPSGRLMKHVGGTVKVDNPLSWKFQEAEKLGVYTKDDFFICNLSELPEGYRAIPSPSGVTLEAL